MINKTRHLQSISTNKLVIYYSQSQQLRLASIPTPHETGPSSIRIYKQVPFQRPFKWVSPNVDSRRIVSICWKTCLISDRGAQAHEPWTCWRAHILPIWSRNWWLDPKLLVCTTALPPLIQSNPTLRQPPKISIWNSPISPQKSLSSRKQRKWTALNGAISNLKCLSRVVHLINLRQISSKALRSLMGNQVVESRLPNSIRQHMSRILETPGLTRRLLTRLALRWLKWEVLSHLSCLMNLIKHRWRSLQT